MLETHLRQMYRLLNHKGFKSRIGWLYFPTKEYQETYVTSEEEAVEIARKYAGTHNIFISRAARNPDGSFHHSSVITFDLDPIRPKDTASSDEQHKEALNAARRILGKYSGGFLASSGNGALLIYRLSSPIVDVTYYEKEKVLINELQKIAGEKVKVDATSYATAVIKFIGTQSTKGRIEDRRVSRFLDLPIPPFRASRSLLQRLAEISVTEKTVLSSSLPLIHDGDRSVADYNLVCFLKEKGANAAAALAALQANPYGRQHDEKDQARLISKIYGAQTVGQLAVSDTYFEKLFTPKASSDGDVNTGFNGLDSALGPLPKGELSTFAARSGFGKTTWGCTIAEYWRKQGKRVVYFSTEMAAEYIMHKLVSLACEIPLTATIQKSFTAETRSKIRAYENELKQRPIFLCDEFQPTIELVRNEVIKHKPDIIIFDHITQSGTHWEYVAQFARDLKELTSKEGIVTVLLSMLSEPGRGKDGNVATSIRGDIRGSQEILYLSAIFCMFSNPYEVKGRYQPIDVLVAKNRYGISNQVVPLSCDKEISKYVERLGEHESNMS